jgi:hypothetical protein
MITSSTTQGSIAEYYAMISHDYVNEAEHSTASILSDHIVCTSKLAEAAPGSEVAELLAGAIARQEFELQVRGMTREEIIKLGSPVVNAA